MKLKHVLYKRDDLPAHLPSCPGVYQILNANGDVLYVGKARHLRKRVSSYFRTQQSKRITLLMNQMHFIKTIVTSTENEALLLESNLIKRLHPRYNILLRDDKSYPYITLSAHHAYPRLSVHRSPKKLEKFTYFGPYPSTISVRKTINLLQKIFRLRSCTDTFFNHRTRPCLQYQIKRCNAPCVNYISIEAYQRDVLLTRLFLEGKNQEIINVLVQKMEEAAKQYDFEKAAEYRDQVASLRQIQQQQAITSQKGNADVIALVSIKDKYCIQVMRIRQGHLLGGYPYFLAVPLKESSGEILAAFISQYYLQSNYSFDNSDDNIPDQLILSHPITDSVWLTNALKERTARNVSLISKLRGECLNWMKLAIKNAEQELTRCFSREKVTTVQRLEALQRCLNLKEIPKRLECLDISHTQGEATVASCVVFGMQGLLKNEYRRFNINNVTLGDDLAAMQQALLRRYKRSQIEKTLPDVLIVDGGKNQLKQAKWVLEKLEIKKITVLSIAKGPHRKSDEDSVFLLKKENIVIINPDTLALHLIQQLRDEAHRFAIGAHRRRREKARQTSILRNIPGIGPKRQRELLKQFGGLRALMSTSTDEISKTPGISQQLAKRIYIALHK